MLTFGKMRAHAHLLHFSDVTFKLHGSEHAPETIGFLVESRASKCQL